MYIDDIDKTILTCFDLGILFVFACMIAYCALYEWRSGDYISSILFYIANFVFIGLTLDYFMPDMI